MDYKFISFQQEGRVMTLSLNRPPTNPLNSEFGREMFAAFSEVEQNEDITAVIITSAQSAAFVAGADIKEMAEMASSDFENFCKLLQGANNVLNRMKKVVIAAINGHALGGGCELALACDYRIMASGKFLIGLPEATLGILPGAGGTQRLPRLVGLSKALDILLNGKAMSPDKALEIGLVDKVVEPEALMAEAQKLAGRFAAGAGKAIGYIKAAVYEGIDLPLEQALAVERKYSLENVRCHDAKEGLSAFAEKRKPEFKNC